MLWDKAFILRYKKAKSILIISKLLNAYYIQFNNIWIFVSHVCVCEYSCTWWLPYFQDFLQHQKVNAWACKIYCCPNSAIIILQGHKYAKNGIIVMIFCVCMCMLAYISITTKHKNEVGENMKIAEALIIPWCM